MEDLPFGCEEGLIRGKTIQIHRVFTFTPDKAAVFFEPVLQILRPTPKDLPFGREKAYSTLSMFWPQNSKTSRCARRILQMAVSGNSANQQKNKKTSCFFVQSGEMVAKSGHHTYVKTTPNSKTLRPARRILQKPTKRNKNIVFYRSKRRFLYKKKNFKKILKKQKCPIRAEGFVQWRCFFLDFFCEKYKKNYVLGSLKSKTF